MKKSLVTVSMAALLLTGCAVKPQPMSLMELETFAQDNLDKVVADQEPITGQVGLYEAMARALKYNLDYRVELMNQALAVRNLDLKRFDALPQVVANSHYMGRSNESGGVSKSLLTGLQSLEPSTSQEKEHVTADLTLTWHVLDFGLSYVRAKQAADEVTIAEERKRKVVNKIIEDVRTAYWRAVSAERLVDRFRKLEGRVERALRNSRKLARAGHTSPLTALTYERELVDIKKQINQLLLELRSAKIQLAALMNVPPGSKFSLVIPKRHGTELVLRKRPEELVQMALVNRPELREQAYRGRINEKEAEAAVLELLPGASLYAGLNLDTNDFLFNNHWAAWGAKASWNLIRVFTYPAKKRQIEAKDAVLQEQALALTMAVMTQVHVARVRYHHAHRIMETSREYKTVQHKIVHQVRAQKASDLASEQSLIREEMNDLVAAVKFDVAYADLQNAFAAVYASVGVDPYDGDVTGQEDVGTLAAALRRTWIARGDRSGG